MSDLKKWKLLGKKIVFESKWLTVEDRAYELPNGEKVEGYYHVNRPDYVLIVAIDDKGRIVVERQYRRAADEFMYELPAGWMGKEELPIAAAIRELKEETGFVGKGEKTWEVYVEPGFMGMKAHVVILEIVGVGEQARDKDEVISYELMTIERVREMIKKGEIRDMGFLAAMAVYETI